MSTSEDYKEFETYFDLMSMHGGSRIYRTAWELDIIKELIGRKASAKTLAIQCGLQEKPLRIFLNSLCSLGILKFDGESYSLKPVMQFLTKNYKNLSDEYWDYLPQFLMTGNPMAKMDCPKHNEEQYLKQVTALEWMMKPVAETSAEMLGLGKSRSGLNILDVGAGSAIWSLTFAMKDTHAQVTALDWSGVLKIATSSAKRKGLHGRFSQLAGNYHEVGLPDDKFDLAIVANVTHIETPEGNISLFQKLFKTLKPGGEIVIFDVMPGQESGNLARALYELGLALRTEKGRVHSTEELGNFLLQSGFPYSTYSPIPVPPFTMGMILAKKEF
jgi:2-polyprenyl-3-methyl-5-hydroxy-6-metoxy-1,4-benzoquinol methylase